MKRIMLALVATIAIVIPAVPASAANLDNLVGKTVQLKIAGATFRTGVVQKGATGYTWAGYAVSGDGYVDVGWGEAYPIQGGKARIRRPSGEFAQGGTVKSIVK